MKKLSRLKTGLFSLPLILAAIVLVFISSDSDKDLVKGVFTDMTRIAHADVAGTDCTTDCTTDCSFDCSHPGTTIPIDVAECDCASEPVSCEAGPGESY